MVPDAHVEAIAGSRTILADVDAKAALLRRTGAAAVDMESHIAARAARDHGLPFVAVRTISDGAYHTLPPAALVALKPDGRIDFPALVRSLLAQPAQIPGLIRTARKSERAFAALLRCRSLLGPGLRSRISANLFSTWRENTNCAGRCLSSAISVAMGASVLTPRRATTAAFSGCLTISMTDVASKPLCTMQLAHFS